MAQSNFEERIDTYEIESTNVMTGDRDRSRYLYYQLKMSIAEAKQIDIIVSFLMESGVRMLLNDMKRALDRDVKIRILTGNYLGITQPSALYLIKSELGDRVDLRLYNETSRSFHPKSYIFHYESSNEIYIGSSNISKSALTSGIEWNYRFSDTLDKKNYELFYATFEDLFLNHSIIIDDEELKRYSKAWKKPSVSRDLAKYDATEDGEDRNAENVRMLYRPRGAQIEALYALQESRMEGAAKGLVYAATGIGKTYLAAFDSAKYERVLFVAHREEILKQAAVSFKNVRNSEDYGFFDGKEKDRDKSVMSLIRSCRSRDIDSYNEKNPNNRMKRLIIIIDEYADLIQTAEMQGNRKSFEKFLSMLAQKVRSLGIHLIIATQRPSANIVTGVLKANIPYRISFRLPSHTDSQTILDMPGAENLLGKGDMLMVTDSDTKRMQGLFVSEHELEKYIESKIN